MTDLRVEKTQLSSPKEVKTENKQDKQEKIQEQTFNYMPDKNEQNKGLEVEHKPYDPPRMAGVLQRIPGNSRKPEDRFFSVVGAIDDAVIAPFEVTMDLLSGANNKDNNKNPRTTGFASRDMKNQNIFLRVCAGIVDITLSPVTTIIDACTGANKKAEE